VLLLCHTAVKAQLCTGSKGDPIINQDFGAGNSFVMNLNQSPLKKINGCPNKGEYTISNFLFGCGGRTWLQMVGDHTRNYQGNYMLVNAESTPGIIYTDTARNLCEGTNYVFSAWISNAMQSFTCGGKMVLTNLIITVKKPDGSTIANTSTGDIPFDSEKVWKEYGVSFVCPPGVPYVIVAISSAMMPGCGGGFVMDDITFRSCGPTVDVTLDGLTGNVNVCADYTTPFILNAKIGAGFADPVLQWQSSPDSGVTWTDIAGANTSNYAIPRRIDGMMNYRLAISERKNLGSPQCMIISNSIYTRIHPVPIHKPPSNFTGCLDKDLLLPETDPKALSIKWTGQRGFTSADPFAKVPNVQYADTGLYVLNQNFYFGCTTVDSFYLTIFPSTTITALPGKPVCEGISQQLSVSATGGGSYKWYPSDGLSRDDIGNPIATPKDSTEYKVIVTNQYGCKDSAKVVINVYRNLLIDAGPDRVILTGDTATILGSVKGTGVVYSWSPTVYISNTNTMNPKAFPPVSTEYTVSAISTVGCGTSSDRVWVNVYDELQIPNVFTPNGDGKNDVFRVLPLANYNLTYFRIFDRFGQVVFQTKDINQSWNGIVKGKEQPTGTYTYQVEMINNRNQKILRKGTVTLIR
jgi:gliding motility-associated-like protein